MSTKPRNMGIVWTIVIAIIVLVFYQVVQKDTYLKKIIYGDLELEFKQSDKAPLPPVKPKTEKIETPVRSTPTQPTDQKPIIPTEQKPKVNDSSVQINQEITGDGNVTIGSAGGDVDISIDQENKP